MRDIPLYLFFFISLSIRKGGTKEHTLRDPLVLLDSSVPFLREHAGTYKGHFEEIRNKNDKFRQNHLNNRVTQLLRFSSKTFHVCKMTLKPGTFEAKKEHFAPKKEQRRNKKIPAVLYDRYAMYG